MHVALIGDTDWLDDDWSIFKRLAVGLIDRQVRVVQVVPQQRADPEDIPFDSLITWRDSSWALTRQRRLSRLADQLDQLGVDLIHAIGGGVWGGVMRLASHLKIPAVFGLSSASDLAQINRIRRIGDNHPAGITASTDPLAAVARQKLPPQWLVRVVPPGVDVLDSPSVLPDRHGDLCVIVSGTGVDDEDYLALLNGIALVVAKHPRTQFFFDGMDKDQHALWQMVRSQGMLSNVSMISRGLRQRELMMQGHLLIHPQALGQCRGLTLEALAHGVPIIAREDPWLDYLIDDQTAWLIPKPEPEQWAAMIRRVIEDPARARSLADRGRAWVRQRHLVADYVDQTLALYQELGGESIKFPSS